MSKPLRLLIVEDCPDDAELMIHSLLRDGVEPTWTRVETVAELASALKTGAWDAVLSDYTLPECGATAAIEIVHAADPDMPILVVSGTVGEERAVETMRAGASDYVLKDNLVRLGPALDREVRAAENRRAKRAAEKVATHLAAVVEFSHDAIISMTPDGMIESWNAAAGRLHGWTAAEAVGRHISFIVPPEKADELAGVMERLRRGDHFQQFDTTRLHRDGTLRYVSIAASLILDLDGRLVGISNVARNIGDRMQAEAELRESEERFRHQSQVLQSILDSMSDGVVVVDETGKFLLFNPAAEQILRLGKTEARPEEWQKEYSLFLPPDGVLPFPTADNPMVKAMRGEASDAVEMIVNHDGIPEARWISVNAKPMRDAAGNVRGGIMVFRNITEKKQAENALRASEVRYRTLVEASATIVWDCPASGHFDSEQAGWTAFTGQTVEQHRGWGWLNAIHPDDREKSAQAWARTVRDRSNYQVEHRLRRVDGEYRQMFVRAVPIFEPNGMIREWVGVHTDVTDQKLAEKDLRLRDRALAVATQGLLITDMQQPDNPSVYVNPGFERMTGYLVEDVLGRNCRFLQGKDTDPAAVTRLRHAVRAGEKCSVELLNYRKDGTSFWNELSITPVRDEGGRLTHFVGVQSNVSARRALEEQFRQSQKMDAFGQLAAGVAHDFNNLLTIINGFSDIVLRGLAPDDKSRSFIKEIIKAGERSAALTAQLLAFSRKQVVVLKVLDLNAVVLATEKMLRRIIGEDIDLVTLLAEDIGAVRADSGQLEQVLLNLAVNARDAMPQGGKLSIETKNVELQIDDAKLHVNARPGPYVLLVASDTGCGMTDEVKKRIFEPFFTTKGVGGGTGLGLATVFGIVSQADGYVEVTSEVNLGTSFKIYLPRVNKVVKPSSDSVHLDEIPRGVESILLVEDEVGLRGLLYQVLNDCGYSVSTAASGVKALQLAQEHPGTFDVIVTDVVMPGMSGRQMVEQLVARYPKVKIIYMSGYTDDAVVRHGILHEHVPYLQKPFLPAALASKVREVLDS